MKSHLSVVGLSLLLASFSSLRAAESSFTELGFLPGYETSNFPTSMADDGSTVVGWSVDVQSNRAPYIWRQNTGIAPLTSVIAGVIAGSFDNLTISGDGDSIFVGAGTSVSRWTQNGGLAPLFTAPVGSYAVAFSGSSTDGRSLAGLFYADGPPNMPAVLTSFVWREDTGLTTINDGFLVRGISPDGNYLIGNRQVAPESALTDVIRRSIDGAETIVDSYVFADATSTSENGAVVIGNSTTSGFYWTDGGSPQPIGHLPMQGDATSPLDVSHDGSIVVGYAEGAPQGAFIWDAQHGMRSIHALLLDQDVDVTNRTFGAAQFISADGRTILGAAPAGSGGQAAWIATVVPEPSTALLAAIAIPIVLLRRRLHR